MHYSESDFAWICKYIKKMDGFEERQVVAGLVVLELARLFEVYRLQSGPNPGYS